MIKKHDVHYGLHPGDQFMVIRKSEKKTATVVKEYRYHILMDYGKYLHSVNKADVYTGEVRLERR